jgi:hypothetical protein
MEGNASGTVAKVSSTPGIMDKLMVKIVWSRNRVMIVQVKELRQVVQIIGV